MNLPAIIILGFMFSFYMIIRFCGLGIELHDIFSAKYSKLVKGEEIFFEFCNFVLYSMVNYFVLTIFWDITAWTIKNTSNPDWLKYFAIIPVSLLMLSPMIFAKIFKMELHWRFVINMFLAGNSIICAYMIILFGGVGVVIASILNAIPYLGIIVLIYYCSKYADAENHSQWYYDY